MVISLGRGNVPGRKLENGLTVGVALLFVMVQLWCYPWGSGGVDGDDILMMEQLMSAVAARSFLAKPEAARKKSSDVPSLVAALLRAAG